MYDFYKMFTLQYCYFLVIHSLSSTASFSGLYGMQLKFKWNYVNLNLLYLIANKENLYPN